MKIAKIEDLHADAGWTTFSFLKVTTDDGLVGWSEYTEGSGSPGLTSVIHALGEALIGQDPRPVQQIASLLYTRTVQAPGGVNSRAVAALEHALWDLKGKALGVPVYELFGGPVRDRVQVYWSHCGSYRVRHPDLLKTPPLHTYADVERFGAEVKARGFKGLKTNVLPMVNDRLTNFQPGFGRTAGFPALNLDRNTLRAITDLLTAFRAGAGPEMQLHLDTNYHFKTEGYIKIARALGEFDMTWLELDTWDPEALALIRRAAPCPIASCESVVGRRAFRPFFDAYAMDVAIIDVIWNGWLESLKVAAMAESYEVNVAPHNYYGHLASAISAHFCAVVPNLRVMETDVDSAPWRDELFSAPMVIENGDMVIPKGPGWGIDVNEAGVRAHPPRR
jgi:L-alanine-DL-glutamate epimerase-like enolase superfamily enzyme